MEEKTTPSLYGERGAGGKFRKPPARKSPSKPYDRPPPTPAAHNRGWLSKIIDPAYCLLAGGATKIFPSFFSNPGTTAALPPPADADNPGDHDSEVAPSEKGLVEYASSHAAFVTSEGTSLSEVPKRLKRSSEFVELVNSEVKNSADNVEISRIEQLIERKTFSRDEINHLMEILNSKVIGVSEVEQEAKKAVAPAAVENEVILLTRNGEQEENNRSTPETPGPQSNVSDEVGASPIDIARAYMGSRKLGRGPGPYNDLSKAEIMEFASNLNPSPSSKASPCWPGAVVPNQRGYVTPLSQKGRYGLHDFPRTPYSRTIYSKSRGELIRSQANSRLPSSPSSSFLKSGTWVYGQAKTRNDVLDGVGSVGPVRRVHNKFASEARGRGSIFSKPLTHTSSVIEMPDVSNRFLPTVEKNLERGETSSTSKYELAESRERRSEEGNLLLNPSTNQAVRRILEHLDRKKPSPKEKAAELKLTTAWRNPSPKISEDLMTPKCLLNVGDEKNGLSSEGNNDKRDSNVQGQPSEASNEARNANTRVSESSLHGDSGMKNHVYVESSSHLKSISDPQVQRSHEKAFVGISNGQKDTNEQLPSHDRNNEQSFSFLPNVDFGVPKKPPTQSSGAKPILPSIFISKPDPGRVVSSDNGLGFTFPVSASFGVSSEPPTPSLLPSSSPGLLPLPAQGSTIPSYSFGTNKSSPRLVFSFPTMNTASTNNDTSDFKFKFGSDDNNTRLSFKLAGKDAVC